MDSLHQKQTRAIEINRNERDFGSEIMSLTERPSWHARAACRGVGSETFFPTRGESVEMAKQYCGDCPVAPHCLASALEHGDGGIWAGTSGRQRRQLRRLPTERSRVEVAMLEADHKHTA